MDANIHHVTRILIAPNRDLSHGGVVRTIFIETRKGETFELTLFSADDYKNEIKMLSDE